MTNRKKKGIGFFISGIAFTLVGGAMYLSNATPEWIGALVAILGVIAETFGFKTVFPDKDEE